MTDLRHAGCLPDAPQPDQDMVMGEADDAQQEPDQAAAASEEPPTILAAAPAADASEEIVLRDAEEDDAGSLPDLDEAPPEGPQAPAAEGACLIYIQFSPHSLVVVVTHVLSP